MTRVTDQASLADDEGNLRPEVADALQRGIPRPQRPPVRLARRLPSVRAIVGSAAILITVFLSAHFIANIQKRPSGVPVVRAEVSATNVLMRANPGLGGTALEILQPGQRVEVLSLQDGWAEVRLADEKGWIYGGFLRGLGGHGCLGSAAVVTPVTVVSATGRVVLYRDQKLFIETVGTLGHVIAVLPDRTRVSVARNRLTFSEGTP